MKFTLTITKEIDKPRYKVTRYTYNCDFESTYSRKTLIKTDDGDKAIKVFDKEKINYPNYVTLSELSTGDGCYKVIQRKGESINSNTYMSWMH